MKHSTRGLIEYLLIVHSSHVQTIYAYSVLKDR